MIGDFPSKNVNTPYIVLPSDLGTTLNVLTAGDIIFSPLLSATDAKYSMYVANQSAGNVTLRTQGDLLRVNGTEPAESSMLLPTGSIGLMAAYAPNAWIGTLISSVTLVVPTPVGSPSPVGSPGPGPGLVAVLYWGPTSGDFINGQAWNSNPTLAVGSTYSFSVRISNPVGIPLAVSITETYSKVSAGTDFTNYTVGGSSHIVLNGSITVTGIVGTSGYIRLLLTDPYGTALRADIPFIVGAAVVSAPVGSPVGSPVG